MSQLREQIASMIDNSLSGFDSYGEALRIADAIVALPPIAAAPTLYEALAVIISNAALIPDPATGESTDCYAVPIDDICAAEAAFAKARGETL